MIYLLSMKIVFEIPSPLKGEGVVVCEQSEHYEYGWGVA